MLFGFVAACVCSAQWVLPGVVMEHTESGDTATVVGANVYWLGTTTGTTTGPDGTFSIPVAPGASRLVISAVGYVSDTITVTDQRHLHVVLLSQARQVADVEVVRERSATVLDYMSPTGVHVMTEKELFKAACCNLSESFETNPSVDVAFTDAITGTRQIEMLGLAGTYSQITLESMPAIRGLTSNSGLTYIPGPWIQNIQVSKGVGSVANGYESITGQINVELRKPATETESRFFVNLYGSSDTRLESNLHYRERLGDSWSMMTLLHLGSQRRARDDNGDRFLDLPLSTSVNALQRFMYSVPGSLEGQFSLQFVNDEKEGGTMQGVGMDRSALAEHPLEYGFQTKARQWRFAGKTGRLFSEEDRSSIGLQYAYADYHQDAFFGVREYTGREQTGYLNLLYETNMGSEDHHLRTGAAFLFDAFHETFMDVPHQRTERVPGLFAEYTFMQGEVFSVVTGLRVDRHNLFGTFVTPRLHVRYAPSEDWVLRVVGGRGERSANIFAENLSYLASSRSFELPPAGGVYPFDPEVAWNVGGNITRYFTWRGREGTIVDLDRSPGTVAFSNLSGGSSSNSAQLELNAQPAEGLDARLAYRFLDVQQTTGGTLQQRPFVARHRAFVNLAYATKQEGPDDPRMTYDATVQWFGTKRLPVTAENPPDLRVRDNSPPFVLVNAQVTRSFSLGFDLYLGVENFLDFRQLDPILDPGHPNGEYFDGSFVWGPVTGRMLYLGMRVRM
jgi:hypothetical protein